VNAYTLTLAGLILLAGSLGDRYGRRRVFVLGVVWFAVASALCAAAVDVKMLIAARALEGNAARRSRLVRWRSSRPRTQRPNKRR
jgi:MFS family permease